MYMDLDMEDTDEAAWYQPSLRLEFLCRGADHQLAQKTGHEPTNHHRKSWRGCGFIRYMLFFF